jgi:hypothetical protein
VQLEAIQAALCPLGTLQESIITSHQLVTTVLAPKRQQQQLKVRKQQGLGWGHLMMCLTALHHL